MKLDLKAMIVLKDKPSDILFIEASALAHGVPVCQSLKHRTVFLDEMKTKQMDFTTRVPS